MDDLNSLPILADILLPAFWAGLLVISTHIPLGMRVLERGVIFMDLAIAQVAGLGALLMTVALGDTASPLLTQIGAVTLALLSAFCLMQCERLTQRYQEPIIGSLFVLAATAGILVLAGNPHAGERMTDLLAGQILWVKPSQLLLTSTLTVGLLILLCLFRRSNTVFFALFAVAITLSVQLVGVYLVFATLIIPALATVRENSPRKRYQIAYGLAVIAYAGGLVMSAFLDLPSGPLIVWSLALCGSIFAIVRK